MIEGSGRATYLPKRFKRCPSCGDKEKVQYVYWGMPAAPTPEEEARIHFAGCVIDVEHDESGDVIPQPKWYCPSDNLFYS